MTKFSVEQNCVLHGFSGYFEAVLFESTRLSINPETHSPEMFSWFPIFFPIKDPLHLKAGDEIVVHFWRRCNSKQVWYEWCISKPVPGFIHNLNGRSYTIGLWISFFFFFFWRPFNSVDAYLLFLYSIYKKMNSLKENDRNDQLLYAINFCTLMKW